MLISGFIFIYNNACPHSAAVLQQLLGQFKWDGFDYPAYSLDLAPSDFQLLPEVKNWLGGQCLQTNKELQKNIQNYLITLTEIFFDKGIEKLIHRYDKCLKVHSDYEEK